MAMSSQHQTLVGWTDAVLSMEIMLRMCLRGKMTRQSLEAKAQFLFSLNVPFINQDDLKYLNMPITESRHVFYTLFSRSCVVNVLLSKVATSYHASDTPAHSDGFGLMQISLLWYTFKR